MKRRHGLLEYSGKDLIERQIYNLSDALRSVPGMAIARTGQLGSQTSLFSRGGESNHVTFLYEGRRLNGGFSGTYNLGELSTLGSSSIEILKGSSSLNGANAMGGTVHMRNELLLVDGYESNVGLSVGSFDTLTSNYSSRFKKGKLGRQFQFFIFRYRERSATFKIRKPIIFFFDRKPTDRWPYS